MNKTWDFYFMAFIFLISLYTVVASLLFGKFEATLLPLVSGGIIFLLAGFLLLRSQVRKGERQSPFQSEKIGVSRGGVTRVLVTVGWMLGFYLATYFLGFLASILLFTLSYLKSRGRSWASTVCFAIATVLIVYGVFEIGLGLKLYRGWIKYPSG